MNKRFLLLFLLCTTVVFLGACQGLDSFGTVPDVSALQDEPFYSELQATVAKLQIPVILIALLSLALGWKIGRFGLAINGFVIGGVVLYTYLGGVEFVSNENFRIGLSIAVAVVSGLLAYYLYNLMALIIGGIIGSMLMNGAWLQVADKVPPQILVFISTFVSALVMFLVFRLFLVAFSAIIGAAILMIAIPFDFLWVFPVAGLGIAIQVVIAFLIKDDIFQNMKGDFRAALGQAFGDVLGPFGVLFEHQKEAQKPAKVAPEPSSSSRQADKKVSKVDRNQVPQQRTYQAPQQQRTYQAPQQQQPYQAPSQQPYQAPPQQSYQAPKAPLPPTPATEVNMQRATVFRPENFYIQVSTGQNFPLTGSKITVGRNPDNVIVLNDREVSSYHLMISIQADGVVVWDNSSTNGTLFNGVALLGSLYLRPGDVLQVGATTLRLLEVVRYKQNYNNPNSPI
ncbi:MAG: hypothetical protein Phog2KO_21270 [Phototrophicaceae bacterium]